MHRRLHRRHPHPDLSNTAEQSLQRDPNLHPHVPIQKIHAKWVEGINVFLKVVACEVGVALHDIHNDGPPGFDVARLGVVQLVEAAE